MSDLIKKLNDVYQYAVNNPYSSLYRELYGDSRPKEILTLSDWQSLPPISKEFITKTPFKERLFIPYQDVDSLRVSSGTSGKTPTIWPRNFLIDYPDLFNVKRPSKCILTYFPPQHLLEQTLSKYGNQNTVVLSADLTDLDGSLRFASSVGLDHIMCNSSMLEASIPILQELNVTTQIRKVDLGGEIVTNEQNKRFATIFPNANLGTNYASTDIQGVAGYGKLYPGKDIGFSLTSKYHIEIIDEDGKTLTVDGDIGEIVLSHLWTANNPLPLLRYSTKDLGKINNGPTDPPDKTYSAIGRVDLDKIKIPGGELLIGEVEKALKNIHPTLSTDFRLHFYQVNRGDVSLPKVVLHIATKGVPEADPELAQRIAQPIATSLRVSPTLSYIDGVSKGLYAELECKIVPPFKSNGTKIVRFIRHD